MGQILTFYSFKGGVGRSMALANVGVVLAHWGYNVLLVDFDLEAPGLENYFSRGLDLDAVRQVEGIIDLFTSAQRHQIRDIDPWLDGAVEIRLPGVKNRLSLLTAGQRSKDYFKLVRGLDVGDFYSSHDGGSLIEDVRDGWKEKYDFVLVDSRTGLTEIGGVCTVQLPDTIVMLFTATDQGLMGGLDIIRRAGVARQGLPFERPQVQTIPIPSRLDFQSEFRLAQQWLDRFARELEPTFADWLPTTVRPRALLEQLKLPHVSFFSFGEGLPVLDQGTSDPAGLGYAYETITALIANGLQNVELLLDSRDEYVKKASHGAPQLSKAGAESRIFISYSHKDKRWLDQLRVVLAPLTQTRSLSFFDDTRITPGEQWQARIEQELASASVAIVLISPDYLASDFMSQYEFPALLTAAENRGLKVFWIAVRPSVFEATEIGRFQALNDPTKPLSTMKGSARDAALVSISRKIADSVGQPY
jgi:hypothetical protein